VNKTSAFVERVWRDEAGEAARSLLGRRLARGCPRVGFGRRSIARFDTRSIQQCCKLMGA
jgi:hypothetical protein